MNLTDDIVEYGVVMKGLVFKLEKQVQQKDQIIQALEKQIETNKKEKKD